MHSFRTIIDSILNGERPPQAGEVAEIHIGPDDELSSVGYITPTWKFVRDWQYRMGDEFGKRWNLNPTKWAYVGVVHMDGVFLVSVPIMPCCQLTVSKTE